MPKVTIYTTPTCPWCHKTKEWMDEHHIKYQEIDVSQDKQAADYITNKSGQTGVPQTEIDGEVIVGYDPEEFERHLK